MSGPQTTQEDANLAQDAYRNYKTKTSPHERQFVSLDGVRYEILLHVNHNDTNGYAGTIYQRLDTGAIIVAHRGTEDPFKDGLTDAEMVVLRANNQLKDAYGLIEQALERAKRIELREHHKVEVTTIGHSLGGTLAQACAYQYGLKGEAFNPYGAVNLGHDIPPGRHMFHNHVMASDPVSSAARHYGDVTVYAKPGDIQRLKAAGYANSELDILHGMSNAVVVAGTSLGAHSVSNFSDIDDKGQRHATVLTHEGLELAQKNHIAIRHYRNDAYEARSVLHFFLNGNPIEKIRGAFEDIKNGFKPDTPPRLMLNENDRPIFDRIRSGVPEHVNDQQVLQATADLRTAGLKSASSIENVALHSGAIYITSDHTAGYAHSKTDLNIQAQDSALSIDQINQAQQQQLQQNMAFQQQQNQAQSMSMSQG